MNKPIELTIKISDYDIKAIDHIMMTIDAEIEEMEMHCEIGARVRPICQYDADMEFLKKLKRLINDARNQN